MDDDQKPETSRECQRTLNENSGEVTGTLKSSGTVTEKATPVQRQSASFQLQLKVLRKCMDRLSKERREMKDVRELLREAIKDVDLDIERVQRMAVIADRANAFQHGLIPENYPGPAP